MASMASAVDKSEAAGKSTQQDDKIDGKQTAEPKSDEEREAAETAAVAAMNQLDLDESSRSMAQVVRLAKVVPHPNADRLAIAEVGGWKVVVLNTSKEGDLGVYFEIDSILPEAPWHNVDASKRRIRTVKLRGELSQGLFLPRNDAFPVDESMWEEGTDLTKVLGIEKRVFEETGTFPLPRGGVPFSRVFDGRGPPKTDEPRVQSNLELLEALKGMPYYVTEKIDGSSGTFGIWNGELKVCSRNLGIAREEEASKPQTAFWAVAARYDLAQKLARNPDWVVQGEVYGPGLCKNRCKARALSLALFNIWSVSEKRYLDYAEFLEAARFLDLPTVRVLEEDESFNYTVEELLEKARGKYPGTSADREGIVVRPKQEAARARMMGIGHNRLSFKVVNNDFLLKNGE